MLVGSGAYAPATDGAQYCTFSAPYNLGYDATDGLFKFQFDISCPGGGTAWHAKTSVQKHTGSGWVTAAGPATQSTTGSLTGYHVYLVGSCSTTVLYRSRLENLDTGGVQWHPIDGKYLGCSG